MQSQVSKKTRYKKYGMRSAKNKLKGWIQDNPNHTLQGLALKCTANFALKISKSSIHRVLHHSGYSYISGRKRFLMNHGLELIPK